MMIGEAVGLAPRGALVSLFSRAGREGWGLACRGCGRRPGSAPLRSEQTVVSFSLLNNVCGALLPELYLELQIFPVKALG